MKNYRLILLFICALPVSLIQAQISHGGSPLFPSQQLLKSSGESFFIEMPAFNLDSLLKDDQLNKGNMRGSFRFANKFYTSIERGKSGYNYTLPDGTKVWQVGIRSKGAYSINVLFSEYHLPPGGRLFLYNSDHSHIVGSFTHENNSEKNILPIQPVEGDEIIVEYTEPAGAAFEGKLKISEVNHDYIGLRVREPANNPANSSCMPNVACQNSDNPNINSTVLIMISGSIACTGSLINNSSENGTPYLLTATHCLNNNFTVKNPDYEDVAGTIITFFNYQQSYCSLTTRGVENMSIAGTQKACVIDTFDIALLRLNETPPDYYHPYYSGWSIEYNGSGTNISVNNYPYINIHHPVGAPKKTGHSDAIVRISNPAFQNYKFMAYSHWEVSGWTEGSTASGSSGSPLYDSNHRVIGGLSGGASDCSGTKPNGGKDYFFAMFRGWEYGNNSANYLKTYLDPTNSGKKSIDGFDPYKPNSLSRLSNANYDAAQVDTTRTTLTSPESGYLFGYNSAGINEFAEEFTITEKAEVVGAYFLVPPYSGAIPAGAKITVHVYKSGNNGPGERITAASTSFSPQYIGYSSTSKNFGKYNVTLTPATECFVKFESEQEIQGKFYIAYEITYPNPASSPFTIVYNTKFDAAANNTAWIRYNSNWIPATQYPNQTVPNTSLAIQPVVRSKSGTSIEEMKITKEENIRFNRSDRTLSIVSETSESGEIVIYSINGQIIEKLIFQGNVPVTLRAMPQGTIGLVKAISGSKVLASKIIY